MTFFVDTVSSKCYFRYLVHTQYTFKLSISETYSVVLFPKAPLRVCCFYLLYLLLLYRTRSSTHGPSLCCLQLCIAEPNHMPFHGGEQPQKPRIFACS